MKKKEYIQPFMYIFVMNGFRMIASSTIQVTVDNETFDGEGRTKETSDWNIWE